MKRITHVIISFILMVCSLTSVCQTFEGTIVYKLAPELPAGSDIPLEEFNMMFEGADTMANLYLKGCNYKFVTLYNKTNAPQSVNLYLCGSGSFYAYMAGQDEYCTMSSQGTGLDYKPLVLEHPEDTMTILGKLCHSIIIIGQTSRTEVFFSKDYSVDAELYKDHPVGFLEYFYHTGAIPLKIITTGNGALHAIVFTAVEIKQEPLSDKVFKLPAFKHFMKPPVFGEH